MKNIEYIVYKSLYKDYFIEYPTFFNNVSSFSTFTYFTCNFQVLKKDIAKLQVSEILKKTNIIHFLRKDNKFFNNILVHCCSK